ncbi:hypothetical protein Pelo_6425 [Pelomyxa schiedti]|nr:hypothetical protein Pelo_6425 [Pelomyxa schiedti]
MSANQLDAYLLDTPENKGSRKPAIGTLRLYVALFAVVTTEEIKERKKRNAENELSNLQKHTLLCMLNLSDLPVVSGLFAFKKKNKKRTISFLSKPSLLMPHNWNTPQSRVYITFRQTSPLGECRKFSDCVLEGNEK